MIQVSVILDSFKVRMGFILFTPGVQRVWKITLSVNSWTEGEGKMNWFVGKLKKYNRRKYFWTYERIFSFKYQRWNFESLYSGHDLLAWTLNSEIKFFAEQFWMFFSFPSAVTVKTEDFIRRFWRSIIDTVISLFPIIVELKLHDMHESSFRVGMSRKSLNRSVKCIHPTRASGRHILLTLEEKWLINIDYLTLAAFVRKSDIFLFLHLLKKPNAGFFHLLQLRNFFGISENSEQKNILQTIFVLVEGEFPRDYLTNTATCLFA